MKKIMGLLLAVVMMVATLGSCGKTHTSESSEPLSVNLDVDTAITATLKVGVENYSSEKKIIGEIGDILTKTFKNVTIEIMPFSGNISSAITGWYNASNMPDIFINNSFDMFTLSDKDIMFDLNAYVDAESKANSDFSVNDYYESYWKLGQANFDGAQYMIPRSADRVVCHYNAAIFNAAQEWYVNSDIYDAALPDITALVENGWTWDSFEKLCTVLRAYYDVEYGNNFYLIDSYMYWEAVYNPIMEAFGVTYFNEDKSVNLNNSNTKAALDFMKKMVDNRWVAPFSVNPANFAGNEGCMLFHSQNSSISAGKLAPYYTSATKISDYYNVVSMPIFQGNEKIGCGAAGYSVYSGSKNADLAWQFLKILLSKQGQNVMADSGSNYVPVRKDMADFTDAENHWGVGFEDLNLAAYTYNVGANNDPDWNCYTTYITVNKPKQANNISTAIGSLIKSYCGGVTGYDAAIATCENSITRFCQM